MLVTSSELRQHLLVSAARDANVSTTQIVGLWLTGSKYEDLINIVGLMAAGYVPQLFISFFSKPDILKELFELSGAKALIYDDAFADNIASLGPHIAVTKALTFTDLQESRSSEPFTAPDIQWTTTAFVAHSSGTTGRVPKLIPCTYGYLHSMVHVKYNASVGDGGPDVRKITNTFGNLANIATPQLFIAALVNRVTTIQSSTIMAPVEEIVEMIRDHGLNRIAWVAPVISSYIRRAKEDRGVFKALKSCDQIIYSSVALDKDDEKWARESGLNVRSSYGSFETGSKPSDYLLRPTLGLSITFVPFSAGDTNAQPSLMEMAVYGGRPDSPHPSLLQDDGMYYTGDLFEQVEPGLYALRGRYGDFVKTMLGFCDAKVIEDTVKSACKGFATEALVLGVNRALPVLFLEVAGEISPTIEDSLKQQVLDALSSYNPRVYKHEEISEKSRIRLVPQGSIPRTENKGNPRRNAAEEKYVRVLDAIFQT